jgi:protein-tyrosine-phosphatase
MKYVLFVCTHNAGRAQMARAFFDRPSAGLFQRVLVAAGLLVCC